MTSEAVYYDIDEQKFVVQVEPTIKFLENANNEEQFENFMKSQSIDLNQLEDRNMLRAAFIVMQVFGQSQGLKLEEIDYHSLLADMLKKENN